MEVRFLSCSLKEAVLGLWAFRRVGRRVRAGSRVGLCVRFFIQSYDEGIDTVQPRQEVSIKGDSGERLAARNRRAI